ncbi:hypothetical protein Hanom_Chr03g00243471 [Helianthus anomalus]
MVAKKQKILADKKRELDEQAALAFSEKKMKVMGETVAPSESEVDLGVFSKMFGNLLKKIYDASSMPRGMILRLSWLIFGPPVLVPRLISLLLLHLHLLPVPFGVSPPRPDPKGKGKEGTAEGDAGKKVIPNVAPGVVIREGDPRVERAETDWESSKATPQGTIYTRRGPSTPGGGGHSGSRQGPKFRKVEGGGSWMDHNPTCDNLPHIPRWGLAQGSRMDGLDNCHDFYSLSLAAAERLFQKNRKRFDLLDEHVQSVVIFFSTT